jgi:Flp pilus assembly protein protease CpaA
MPQWFILSILAFITIVDIHTHRITNRSLFILGLALFTDIHSASSIHTLIAVAMALSLCVAFKIGMGDFKLFSVLVITQGALVLTVDFLSHLFLVTLVTVTITIVRRKGLSGSIAFAPCIAIPFGLVYLGI